MSQHKFGSCINEFAPRPDHAGRGEPYIGSVPQFEIGYPGWCSNEQSRRNDGLVPSFGNKQVASTAKMTLRGLADPTPARGETFQTQTGKVLLAKEQDTWQYLPSIDTINILTNSTGSRLQPLPARFYER